MGERIIHTTRKALVAAGVVALVAAGSTACDPSNKLSTAAKVKQAFDKLGEQKSLTTEIGLDGGAEKIFAAMKDADDFTREDADMLAAMRLTYAFGSDKPLKDATADDKGFTYDVRLARKDAKPLFEARQVDGKSYVRLDLKAVAGFAERHGKDKSKSSARGTQAIDKLLKQADELPASLASVKNALKGDWISIDPASFEEFAKSMGKGGDSKSPKPDPETQKRAYEALQRALTDNAKVKDAGKKDGVDHVTATLPAKKIAKDFAEGLKPLKDKLGDKAGKLDKLTRDADKAPDKDVTLDLAIKDGMLAGVTFDVAQLADEKDKDKPKGPLPVAIGFKKGGGDNLKVPSGAQELKPQDLMGAAMFVMGGGRAGGAGGDSPFKSESPFKSSDPFKSDAPSKNGDPFADDPFKGI
ncbi:hypothetical protein [Streptomyces cinnamoneus]|uniref:Uncharacterized protein n=1 Tax=Streptomyces cinnamoneus TaxID=53446 RepID=A0A918U1F3_STRCJ|nr:hypothetical protein [Streptomyces cinnamoneus]GHC66023.1 hypothetical protein GCM10010507_49580 [Streptomyces cinnamoneus]